MWKNQQKGVTLIMTMVFTSIFLIIGGGLISLINQQQKLNRIRKARAQALHVAEAGANYYRWHLAHAPSDYTDGTGDTCDEITNPCIRDYSQGTIIGQFSLDITPPPVGSTIVTIKSTGWITDFENYERSVVAKYGLPSWARYAVVANADMRFGEGTETHGPIHSNGGIRFDGLAYNQITSAQATYDDPDHDPGTDEFGVHTHIDPVDPLPPGNAPTRLDVFFGGREFPVPTVDFNAITIDLASLEAAADDPEGLHLNKSNRRGWHIELRNDNMLRYRKVRTTDTCWWWDWGWWSAPEGNIDRYQGNWSAWEDFPTNGVIFVSDNVWIDGAINGDRLTIVAAEDPLASGSSDIWINNDIDYTNYDGTDAIGLIAQNDINIGLYSEDDLNIDAAMVAQKGRVGRYYYPTDCSSTYYQRNSITNYGTIATNQRYGFSWICNETYCSGYETRNLTFDNNLTYTPPPSFPTTDTYEFISWEEVLIDETY